MYYADAVGEPRRAVKRTRSVEGVDVTTWTREVASSNTFEAEAGTNGPQGGDAGHGCRAYLRLEDRGGTDWRASLDGRSILCPRRLGLVLEGDSELSTFKEALRWWLTVLEAQSE